MTFILTHFKRKLSLFISFIIFASGCATTIEKAVEKDKAVRDQLIIDSLTITPKVAKPRDKIKVDLWFSLISLDEQKYFNVSETIILSNGKEEIDLIKKETKKPKGVHSLTLEITIPSNPEIGEYKIIARVSADDQTKTKSESFTIKK